ncbi:MAG: glycosyltransferase [Chitinophagaceae bacterium]|jgi:glycosyltransferase involved in cell wall biosynthesis|nr:glycosyltransferase [Chitinophagaceae bacterium]
MKRILFVNLFTVDPQIGGVERVTTILTKEFLKRGFDVLYLSLAHHKDENIERCAAPQYFFPEDKIYSDGNILFYNNFITTKNIDVVINQFGGYESSFLFLNIKPEIRRKIKVISVCHNRPIRDYGYLHKYAILPEPDKKTIKSYMETVIKIATFPVWWGYFRKKKRRDRYYRLLDFSVSHSDKFVVLSKDYISDVVGILGNTCDKNKLVCIANPNTYFPEEKFVLNNKQKQVLYVGRLSPAQKRPDILIKVWRKIYKQYPDWQLIFVGTGSLEKYLKKYADKHRLNTVFFKGIADPLPYYKTASIFALPSIYEGFPMVLPEAMINSVVPIVFDSYGAARDIIPENTGIRVKPFDKKRFAEALAMLMKNETLLADYRQNARRHIKQFEAAKIADKYVQIIEQ